MRRSDTRAADKAPYGSFRAYLQQQLAELCARNPRYSLRSFARRLQVDHSTLSQYLRGRRRIVESTIRRFGARLGTDAEAVERFVHYERVFPSSQQTPRQIQIQYAILELMQLPDFQTDSRWMARVLDVTADEVNPAITQLLSLRLLEMSSRHQWKLTGGHTDGTTGRTMADRGKRSGKG